MSLFPKAVPAKAAKTKESRTVALVYAGLLGVLAVAQLVTFQQFVLIIDSYWLPGGMQMAAFLAGFLVAAELLALPFLLRLKLSPAFRLFSMGLGWLVGLLWLALSLHAMFVAVTLQSIGMLGGLVHLVPGWWAVCISLGFIIMSVWASWGLWPLQKAKNSRTSKK